MHAHDVIVVDVFVVREMELGWLCEIAGRPTFLGKLQLPADTCMPAERTRGQVGSAVLSHESRPYHHPVRARRSD